jgi:hypothetical protein
MVEAVQKGSLAFIEAAEVLRRCISVVVKAPRFKRTKASTAQSRTEGIAVNRPRARSRSGRAAQRAQQVERNAHETTAHVAQILGGRSFAQTHEHSIVQLFVTAFAGLAEAGRFAFPRETAKVYRESDSDGE